MATKKCPNGHQYDSSIYGDNCPFCPSDAHTRVTQSTSDFADNPTYSTQVSDGGICGNTGRTITTPEGGGGGHTVIRGIGDGTGMPNPDGGRRVVGVLVSYSSNPSGEVFNIYEGRNLVGRAHTADICFGSDDKMSGQHLLILYVEAEGIVWAEDQKSSNGTYINGQFARGMVELHTNDVIVIGSTKMVFLGVPKF